MNKINRDQKGILGFGFGKSLFEPVLPLSTLTLRQKNWSTGKVFEELRKKNSSSNLLLYLHIPFCISKCRFCFKVHELSSKQLLNNKLHQPYIDSLVESIKHYVPFLNQIYQPIGINWGGGTPTILQPQMIEEIAQAFLPEWDLSKMYFSVEATPESLTTEKLQTLKNIGVNRLSIGVQTFNDETLRKLGRCHNKENVIKAVELAREHGFENLNLDLIVSLPGEIIEDTVSSLEWALELDPPHLTTYFYNPTPGTVLFQRLSNEPGLFWDLHQHLRCLDYVCKRLKVAGYQNYEFFHWSTDPDKYGYVSLDHYFGHKGDVFAFGAEAQSFIRSIGCLQMKELPGFLKDPISVEAGKYNLEYALERSLGCREGLNYSSIAQTFGISVEEILNHSLTRALSTIHGVIESKSGLKMNRDDYLREYVVGIHSRMNTILEL